MDSLSSAVSDSGLSDSLLRSSESWKMVPLGQSENFRPTGSLVMSSLAVLTSPKLVVFPTTLMRLIGSSMMISWLEEGEDHVGRVTPKCKNRLGCHLGILASYFQIRINKPMIIGFITLYSNRDLDRDLGRDLGCDQDHNVMSEVTV